MRNRSARLELPTLLAVLIALILAPSAVAAPAITSVSALPEGNGVVIEGQELPVPTMLFISLGTRVPGEQTGSADQQEIAEQSGTRIVVRFDGAWLPSRDRYVHAVTLSDGEVVVDHALPAPLYLQSPNEQYPAIPATEDGPQVLSITSPASGQVIVTGRNLDLLPAHTITFLRAVTADGPFDRALVQDRLASGKGSSVIDWSRTHLSISYSLTRLQQGRWIGAVALGELPGASVTTLPAPVYVQPDPTDPPPVIAVASPVDGMTIPVGQQEVASWTCEGVFETVTRCDGVIVETGQIVLGDPQLDGLDRRLPTDVAGTFTLRITARDTGMHESVRDVTFTVQAADDGDGIADDIDTGVDTFDTGTGTGGQIIDRAGNDVQIVRSGGGDGVVVTVTGTGSERTEIRICGALTVRLLPGTTVELSCGSLLAVVTAGSPPVIVEYPGGAVTVTVPGGTAAFTDQLPDGRVVVEHRSGTGAVLLSFDGVQTIVSPGGPPAQGLSCASGPPVGAILGTARADRISGTQGDDVIFALGGEDVIEAGGGNDIVCSGAGADRVEGGPGDDTLNGEAGADRIEGGIGRDILIGGDGPDTLDGGLGDDTLAGGAGADVLRGGPGEDRLDGGAGADVTEGGAGNDTCIGEVRRACEI